MIDEDDIIEYDHEWKPASMDYALQLLANLISAMPDWDIGLEYREFGGAVIPCFVAHWPFGNIDFGDFHDLFAQARAFNMRIIDIYIHSLSKYYLHAEFVMVPEKWYVQLKQRGVVTCSLQEEDCGDTDTEG